MSIRIKSLAVSLTLALLLLGGALALLGAGQSPPHPVFAQGPDGDAVYYVAPDCTGAPTPCFPSVQAAVDAVDDPTDEVWVATGIYTGVNTYGSLRQVVYISKSLTLRGGYSVDFSTWDPDLYTSTLDAEGAGRVLYITGSTITPTIEGLYLTHGDSDGLGGTSYGPYVDYDAGGGMYVLQTPVIVQNCIIEESTTRNSGGGLHLYQSAAQISHTVIRNNDSNKMGGGLSAYQSPATVSNSIIEHNDAPNDAGGGIYISEAGAFVLESSTVQSNTAASGGGIFAIGAQNGRIENSTIQGNASNYNGGGLYLRGSGPFTLSGNVIRDNMAQGSGSFGKGGGAFVYCGGPFPIQNNVFADNVAHNQGGGVYFSWCSGNHAILENNVFIRNQATGVGGALVSSGGATTLLHTTLSDNRGSSAVYVGDSSTVVFTNTIVHSHTVGIHLGSGTAQMAQTLWDGTISHTLGAVATLGDITGTASFAADGYHLTANSDALDTGADAEVRADVDGEIRPMGDAPDLGADEYHYYADFALSKHGPTGGSAGEMLVYTLTVANAATSELAADVHVVDTVVPDNAVAAMHASAPGGDCAADGAGLTCTLYNVATDTQRLITVWVTSTADYGGVLTNTATVAPLNALDLHEEDNADVVTNTLTYVPPVPDLWVQKAAPPFVEAGAPLLYDLSWGNRGGVTAYTVTLTDTLPNGVSFVTATRAPDSVDPLVWRLGDLAPGATGTATVRVVVTEGLVDGTVLVNRAAISSTTTEATTLNNTDTATTTVYALGGYDLTLTKAADADEVEVGDVIGYGLWITNTGAQPADVTLEDAIPAGTAYAPGSALATDGVWEVANDRLSWSGDLDPGEDVLITFDVTVEGCEGIACGLIRNVATAEIDGVAYVWQAEVESTVLCPDLTIIGEGPERNPQYSDGTHKRYDVVFSYANLDDHPAPGVARSTSVTITVPSGAQLSASRPIADVTSPDQRTKVWHLGDVDAGTEGEIQVQVAPQQWMDDGVVVTAVIAADPGAECDPHAENEDTVTTYPVKMALEKGAAEPRVAVTYDAEKDMTSSQWQVDYLVRYRYQTADPNRPPVSVHTLTDHWPASLHFDRHLSRPALAMSGGPETPHFEATAHVQVGDSGWLRLQGSTTTAEPLSVTNRIEQRYETPIGQGTGTEVYTDVAHIEIAVPPLPLMPPHIAFPESGETCAGLPIEFRGTAQRGVTVTIYMTDTSLDEPNVPVAQAIPDAHGRFTVTVAALNAGDTWQTRYFVAKSAREDEQSAPSNKIWLGGPSIGGWCPQNSYWEGTLKSGPHQGQERTYVFRSATTGARRTANWQIPGEVGFGNSQLHLYSCCTEATQAMTVTAGGVIYTPANRDGHWYHFDIAAERRHLTIESQCGEQVEEQSGVVLIDPDGYVFDIDQGGAYDPTMGGAFNPVAPISGVTVTCMMSAPHWGGWVPWPAHLYDQVNPQVTDDAYPDGVTTPGYYAFFTPPGHYYIQVEGIEGYQAWRSPVVEVITQIVHVNVPYTPWAGGVDALVDLTPDGPSSETITIPAGSAVEWRVLLRATDTITDLITWSENPLLRPLSNRDPLEDTRGFDAGYLEPGQTYRRTFAYPGSYPYTVHGKTGEIIVTGDSPHDYVYLPLVLRRSP